MFHYIPIGQQAKLYNLRQLGLYKWRGILHVVSHNACPMRGNLHVVSHSTCPMRGNLHVVSQGTFLTQETFMWFHMVLS